MTLADALWELTASARWFGGRGRGGHLERVRSLDAVVDVQSLLLDIRYADSAVETYHVPVKHSALPQLVEAVDDGLSLWTPFLSGDAGFRFFDAPDAPTSAVRFPGEQSNTNVFFDNGTMMKVLRRIEPGGGIEAELLEALRGTGYAPELFGTWSHQDTALGILVERIADPADGYDLAVEYASVGRSFAEHSRALGEALVGIHRRLEERMTTSTTDAAVLARTFVRRYEDAAASVEELGQNRDGILARFASLEGVQVPTQRVHGDCHLGQTLLGGDRWRYVDFEGEPMRSIAERREPDSPRRDVAGMLRSFEYASAAGDAPEAWLNEARAAFLDGYEASEPTSDELLVAYELDKAIYEAVYEARFRPELLHVPLAGIERLVQLD